MVQTSVVVCNTTQRMDPKPMLFGKQMIQVRDTGNGRGSTMAQGGAVCFGAGYIVDYIGTSAKGRVCGWFSLDDILVVRHTTSINNHGAIYGTPPV